MAITLNLAAPATDKEILDLSERNPGYQFERTADGALVVTPTGNLSSEREGRLYLQLAQWNERTGLGRVFPGTAGFNLPDGALRAPDASWVRRERWEALPREQREGFAPLCPDAVFEVRSKDQPLADLRRKMSAYAANGARIAVLIDPYTRTVEVCRPGRDPETHVDPGMVNLAPEMPGFVLDLAPLFET